MGSAQAAWLATAWEKRRLQAEALEEFAKIYDAVGPGSGSEIIDGTVEELTRRMETGCLTAKDLVSAYCQRAVEAHQKTNCLTEILFHDALQRADEVDRIIRDTGRLIGPFHGIPITLKDQFDVKGYDSTLGYVGRAFKPAADDAVLVTLMKRLGAVIIAKTNLPQSIMWCETENPLWGLTTNPRRKDFTPGGSTGGEGALLALKGTLLGWGTDIGGSIRIPSHISGLYGFKPSSTRLPYCGVPVSTEGQEHVPSVIGPMARDMSTLTLATKAVIDAKPWTLDPKCCPLPWKEDCYAETRSKKLVIGLIEDDGVVRVHPPIRRVLLETADKLRQAGHEVVPWPHTDQHRHCIEIMDQYYAADGGEDVRRDVAAGGEPFIPHVERLVNMGEPISVYEYWQLNKKKFAAQKRYLDAWNATRSPSGAEIDVLLTPVMPHPAVPHRKCRWVGYTKIWNVLDYSACVVPAGAVDKALDVKPDYAPRNELDRWNWGVYDAEQMDGMPVGVQIVARRLEEEKALGAAKLVDDLLRSSV